jgi:hypothetical protein
MLLINVRYAPVAFAALAILGLGQRAHGQG